MLVLRVDLSFHPSRLLSKGSVGENRSLRLLKKPVVVSKLPLYRNTHKNHVGIKRVTSC